MYLITLELNSLNLNLNLNLFVLFLIILVIVFFTKYNGLEKILNFFNKNSEVTIDEVKLGIGSTHITITPNNKDKEIAYKLWVELSTRKIGIPINEEDDVIYEIYKSWYEFFGIARKLLKEYPLTKINDESSKKIIFITEKILNKELRNHLTKWQAKFRHWYEIELKKEKNYNLSPQEIQMKYPDYNELLNNLKETNEHLINYKKVLYEIVFDEEK